MSWFQEQGERVEEVAAGREASEKEARKEAKRHNQKGCGCGFRRNRGFGGWRKKGAVMIRGDRGREEVLKAEPASALTAPPHLVSLLVRFLPGTQSCEAHTHLRC